MSDSTSPQVQLVQECFKEEYKNQKAIQETHSFLDCFGCGTQNPSSLGLRSHQFRIAAEHPYQGVDISYSIPLGFTLFHPRSHLAGYPGLLHGGVLALLTDCVGISTALAWISPNFPSKLLVTSKLSISYLKPFTTQDAILFISSLSNVVGRKLSLTVSIYQQSDNFSSLRAKVDISAVIVSKSDIPVPIHSHL